MRVRAVLLDLDGTLVDSSVLTAAREARRWKECLSRVHETRVFDGVSELLVELGSLGVRRGVVTSSVSAYAAAILRHHSLQFDTLVAYHDTTRRKPSPDPFIEALRRLGGSAQMAIAVGDRAEDALAATAIGVPALAAGWNRQYERGARWSVVLRRAREVIEHLPDASATIS